MNDTGLKDLIQEIKQSRDYSPSNMPVPITLRNLVVPWLTWDRHILEEGLEITLPPDLIDLWSNCSELVMFYDVTFGQSGLVLWSPDQAYIRHRRLLLSRNEENWAKGDFIIGEFLGESDLLLIRCDENASDFGSIVISTPIDPRGAWHYPAKSLQEFLFKFQAALGEEFWHSR